jgi:7-carboxy-7-deazaguanine synthase
MQIIEIYRSLQGESSFAGIPCTFVRLAACNLRCVWCDSEYTFTAGRKMTSDEVEQEVMRRALPVTGDAAPEPGLAKGVTVFQGSLVEITGGEPMLQERELIPLMERLLKRGYTLLLETSGERPLEHVPKAVHKIVDVKCPGSGEAGTFRMSNLETLTLRDEVKFVMANRADYEFARDFTRQHRLESRVVGVIFSPAFTKTPSSQRDSANCLLDPRELAGWILEDGLNVRLGLQIHKFIWEPATKGV